jgi:hypothetical protein
VPPEAEEDELPEGAGEEEGLAVVLARAEKVDEELGVGAAEGVASCTGGRGRRGGGRRGLTRARRQPWRSPAADPEEDALEVGVGGGAGPPRGRHLSRW